MPTSIGTNMLHLLPALIEDQDAAEVMRACGVDLDPGTDGSQTLCWREVDSNFRFRDALSSRTGRLWSGRFDSAVSGGSLNGGLTTPIGGWAGNCSAHPPRGSIGLTRTRPGKPW